MDIRSERYKIAPCLSNFRVNLRRKNARKIHIINIKGTHKIRLKRKLITTLRLFGFDLFILKLANRLNSALSRLNRRSNTRAQFQTHPY